MGGVGRTTLGGGVDLVTGGADISAHIMRWRAAETAVGEVESALGDGVDVVVGILGSAADRSVRSVRLRVAGMPATDGGTGATAGGSVGIGGAKI